MNTLPRLAPLRTLAIVVSGLSMAVAGCTTGLGNVVGAEPTMLWEQAAETPRSQTKPLTREEARRIAMSHEAAHSCEVTARSMRQRNPARGWQVMEQCIRRKDFSDLEIIVNGIWAEEFKTSPDAAKLLAHVIAVRGGDVASDLRVIRRQRLPLYSLAAALSEPEAYKGRYVLMRGNAVPSRASIAGGRSLKLVETKVMAMSEWVNAPDGRRLSTDFEIETTRQQDISIHGRNTERTLRGENEKVEIFRNINVATGLELVGRLDGLDPHLEPATDYVMLLRFDGVRESDEEEEGLASVVEYFEPQSGLFARLGR
jgi:hypothetical protein